MVGGQVVTNDKNQGSNWKMLQKKENLILAASGYLHITSHGSFINDFMVLLWFFFGEGFKRLWDTFLGNLTVLFVSAILKKNVCE